MMEICALDRILAKRELALDQTQLLALHRTNATLPEFAILKLERAATLPRTMEQPAMMEMLALSAIPANLEFALARIWLFAMPLINVTMLVFATLQPELAVIPPRTTERPAMMETDVLKLILVNPELALDRIRLPALHLINATLLAFATLKLELAATRPRPTERTATMEMLALRPILATLEFALARTLLLALLQINATKLVFAIPRPELAATPQRKMDSVVFLMTIVRPQHNVSVDNVPRLEALFVLHRINATKLEFAIARLANARINQRQMECLATMEMLALNPILVNLEFALARIQLFVKNLINVTKLELAILQPEFAAIQGRPTEQPVTMEICAHWRIFVCLELAPETAQLNALPWINATLLELAIHRLEFAPILRRTMDLLVMMEIYAPKRTLAKQERALDRIRLSAVPLINVTMLEFATLRPELAAIPPNRTVPLATMEMLALDRILANREIALDRAQLLALHRTNATLPEFAILKPERAATLPRTMERSATMEMLALRPIPAKREFALARIWLLALL
jgi:hypothetical protein